MPISKNKIKWIHSLEMKKFRKETGCFLAEGPKIVGELLSCFNCQLLVATSPWLQEMKPLLPSCEVIEVTDEELAKASLQKSPQQVLALFSLPQELLSASAILPVEAPRRSLCLALDGVQDPGNMGTIIRTADWFGIRHIVCSEDTVDVYNPKVVQATMGSIARVGITYTRLDDWLVALDAEVPVYGTLLDGNDIYATPLTENGVIIMGNEGKGISEALRQRISHKLLIPNYPADSETAESLNVAVATAITCSEFRRRMLKR